ncbi:EscE/YscE/SsaE family type III secretion system needle protein co-chaperone [Mesorhizobium sp. M0983]|uniref:EscE/YscE/SsaE family type III secretion system needle protein co-chaperone n=1 Tax=Mesorhizobium sp. M0983 TaxID=2957040 RepID=UPI00333BAC84
MSDVMAMFELQRQLLRDFDGAKRSALEREFDTCRQSLKREMDVGVSRQEFEVLAVMLDAIDAATEIINSIWSEYRDKEPPLGWR